MGQTLYEKVFDRHVVREITPGQYQLLASLHLLNEVSSPQAFEALRERGLKVRHPGLTFGSSDHSIATSGRHDDFADADAEVQVQAMGRNMAEFGATYFDPDQDEHGIIHVVAPERGLTQPGAVIVCGDSHTSTHGAFGAIAFGIGTSQVRDVLASQTLLMEKLKVRRIDITGRLAPGVYAKDVALHVIHVLGAKGGIGFAYEFGGDVVDGFSMEERMTLCNLAIEAGARCGYVNPDQTTYDYLRGRDHAPRGSCWDRAVAEWQRVRSDDDAVYDDRVVLQGEAIEPMVTWGVSPDHSVPIGGTVPEQDSEWTAEVRDFMGFAPGQPIIGTRIDVAFLGSCTNGRLSDFEAVAAMLRDRGLRVASHVRALVVPGSQRVRAALVERGLDRVFIDAGFQFRDAGCSLCCGMNADRLQGREVCASSSNRNFRGRQGSPTGRTLLMSPVMVVAAAIAGEVTDARTFFGACTMTRNDTRIHRIAGRGISIRGDDIDTDQIFPARYLTAITFAGMEAHAFKDARAAAKAQGVAHPLDQPRFTGGSLLLVNCNFGCGSSREHAPQSLHRLGIAAVIGESFGEIFAGNCVSIGMPCVQADAETIAVLQRTNETAPQTEFVLDLAGQTITVGERVFAIALAEGRRRQFLEGTWDPTAVLLAAGPLIEQTLAEAVHLS